MHGFWASKLQSSCLCGKHFIYGTSLQDSVLDPHMDSVCQTRILELTRQVLHGLSHVPRPQVTFHRTFTSSSALTITARHAVLYRGHLILFSSSFLFCQRALGKDLGLSWSISHLSLLPMGVGLLGWTWAPDATSCLATLLMTSSIPGVPNRQWAGKEYDQSGLCFWTQITAVKGVAQHRGKACGHDPRRL